MSKRPATQGEVRRAWPLQAAMAVVVAVGIAVVWATNAFLTERFTESTRARAEIRLTSYAGTLLSELRRTSIVPQLLARDPVLIGALSSSDFSQTSARLIDLREEIGMRGMKLLSADGRMVAATERQLLGQMHRGAPYFVEALRSNGTVFTVNETEAGGRIFTYSRKLEAQNKLMYIEKDGLIMML